MVALNLLLDSLRSVSMFTFASKLHLSEDLSNHAWCGLAEHESILASYYLVCHM